MEECIREDILREFLLQNRAEVKRMSIYEYDDEAVKQALKEDAYEDGKIETLIKLVRATAPTPPAGCFLCCCQLKLLSAWYPASLINTSIVR